MKIQLFFSSCRYVIFFVVLAFHLAAPLESPAYYSIHLASFKSLKNVNQFVNSLKNKGKVVFWKEAEVPGKGLFHRVYIGRYDDRDEAVRMWEKMRSEGAVSYFGVHRFDTEPAELPPQAVPPGAGDEKVLVPGAKRDAAPADALRFIDNNDGTLTDIQTGLMWVKNGWRFEFFAALSWNDASEKCSGFKLGGYSDWRLPSLDEWKSLIDPTHHHPALVEPNPFENIIAHMPYWSGTESPAAFNGKTPAVSSARAYTVMMYYGSIHDQSKSRVAFVLPVRNLK